MSGGFAYENGQMVIRYGGRRVATTGGTLLQFLSNEQTYSTSIGFPNADKARLYMWRYSVTRAPGDNFAVVRAAQSVVGARPQEWEQTVVLGSAPVGADLFVGRIELSRTLNPTHTWLGQTLVPVVKQGVQIQLDGSMLVEMGPGITRALTIDVTGGNLVAFLQQSVGPGAGNFGQNGHMPIQIPPNSTNDDFRAGAENVCEGGGTAIPVWWRNDSPYAFAEQTTYEGFNPPSGIGSGLAWAARAAWGGSNMASHDNSPEYTSHYSITVRGRFGRRS